MIDTAIRRRHLSTITQIGLVLALGLTVVAQAPAGFEGAGRRRWHEASAWLPAAVFLRAAHIAGRSAHRLRDSRPVRSRRRTAVDRRTGGSLESARAPGHGGAAGLDAD